MQASGRYFLPQPEIFEETSIFSLVFNLSYLRSTSLTPPVAANMVPPAFGTRFPALSTCRLRSRRNGAFIQAERR